MKESSTIELKKTTSSLREAIESLVAFANTEGGELFFGIDDDGKVNGIPYSDETLKRIANEIKLNTEPKLFPQLDFIESDGKQVIRVRVDESPLKPHLAYGRAYIRVGSTNQRIDQQKYEYMLQQRKNGYGFDYLTVPDAGMGSIDNEALLRFAERANHHRNANIELYLTNREILEKLDLIQKRKLTNAAILLFGKNPENYFPFHYEVKLGVFPDAEGYDRILNEQEFKGNLFETEEHLISTLMMNLHKSVSAQGADSVENYEFPLSVIREAVVNMLVHRDYRQGVKSTIEVRPGMIVFSNPGHLFTPTITVDKLIEHHPSRPGNKLIAKVFYQAGLFENWGSGTTKIYKQCLAAGKKAPEFSYENGMFKLTLYRG